MLDPKAKQTVNKFRSTILTSWRAILAFAALVIATTATLHVLGYGALVSWVPGYKASLLDMAYVVGIIALARWASRG